MDGKFAQERQSVNTDQLARDKFLDAFQTALATESVDRSILVRLSTILDVTQLNEFTESFAYSVQQKLSTEVKARKGNVEKVNTKIDELIGKLSVNQE